MKQEKIEFIKKGVIFIVLFIIIFSIVNQIYVSIVMGEKSRNKAQIQFNNLDKSNLNTVIFGDSHAWGLNPKFIDNSFNYGSSAESYEQTYYKVRYMINNYPNVEYYVLPIDYASFLSYARDKYSDISYWSKFMSYKELSMASNKSQISLMILDKFPIIGSGNDIVTFMFSNEKKTYVYLGWQSQEISFASDDPSYRIWVGQYRVYSQFNNQVIKEKSLISSFYNIIDILERNNKTIVLVKYPITREYFKAINERGINSSQFYSEFYDLSLKHNKVYILDYQEVLLDNQELFADSDHLDYLGAEVLSKKINEDLKKI